MNRTDAERIITEHLKPIYGFSLKNCRNIQDAEDLSQEIALRAYRALLARDGIADPGKFIWTVAHHTLCNYYRDLGRMSVGVPLDEVADFLADPDATVGSADSGESVARLCGEIAYLSKMQRRIVIAYYFENRKQEQIAAELAIPLGTVKWHLFEAKKELKRGMDTVRKASELKFNPIKFHSYGINGSAGTKSPDEFFRSTLAQNICYCVRNTAKTVGEIADDLGVSPVYVETEVEFLEEYGFLLAQKNRFIVNFIISEPTAELLTIQNDMYKRAAELFANDLYDELMKCKILNDKRILCNHMLPGSTRENPKRDKNFLLWTLIPYIAAWSGEGLMDNGISFEEAATIRPDGAHNIYHASVEPDDTVLPDDYVYMRNWCGPMWISDGERILWRIDSEWSNRGEHHGFLYAENAKRVLSLYKHERDNLLPEEDYAWLSQLGYVKFEGDYNKNFQTQWKILVLQDDSIKKELLAIGDGIKEKHKDELAALKAPYVQAELENYPPHVRKMRAYELQFLFGSDGMFLLHCLHALLENGKLKEPTEEQRKSLTCLICPS